MITPTTLHFLTAIQQNNNKPWFDEHRATYDAAREEFIFFINSIIETFGKVEPTIMHLKAKDCVYRFNRDLRFSKDKRPYKSNFSAFFHAEGRKTLKAGYYISLQPGNTFIGGGLWQPTAAVLQNIRQEIDYNFNDFKKIIHQKNFKTLYGGLSVEEGFVLTRVPKGYEAENPAAEYLKFKSFIVENHYTDAMVLNPTFHKEISTAFTVLKPFIDFLNTAMD